MGKLFLCAHVVGRVKEKSVHFVIHDEEKKNY